MVATDVVVERQPADIPGVPGRTLFKKVNEMLGLESLRMPLNSILEPFRGMALLGLLIGVGFFLAYPMLVLGHDRGFTSVGGLLPAAVGGAVVLIHISICVVSLFAIRWLAILESAMSKAFSIADFDVTFLFVLMIAWGALLVAGAALTVTVLFY